MDTHTDASASSDPHPEAWTAFGLGVIGGVIGGLLLLSLGAILLPGVVLVFAGGLTLRPPFGAAGILAGWGATWIALLVTAQLRCDPASCIGPDLTPWLTFGGALIALSGGLIVIGVRRPRWVQRVARAVRASGASRWFRAAGAAVIGLAAGFAIGTFWTGGWLIGTLVSVLFVWTRRAPRRRVEIVWFGLGVAGPLALVALR